MIYTELTKRAMQPAFEAHKDQVDRAGVPYIYHPVHIAEQMRDENTTCAALLHDVIEDSGATLEQLAQEGFPTEVLSALRLLTHDPKIPYLDYVAALRDNPIAAAVKLADLRHNSDLTRLNVVDEKALARVEKYQKAIDILTDKDEVKP